MQGKKSDLKGKRFGRLTVLRESKKRASNREVIWICLCSCGSFTEVRAYHLRKGQTKSCGCLNREAAQRVGKTNIKHGEGRTGNKSRLYSIWEGMKNRCKNPNDSSYKYYGEKGINVCPEWINNYSAFRFWGWLNGYKDNLTIDRISKYGNYEPSNCQFITNAENARKAQLEKNL